MKGDFEVHTSHSKMKGPTLSRERPRILFTFRQINFLSFSFCLTLSPTCGCNGSSKPTKLVWFWAWHILIKGEAK